MITTVLSLFFASLGLFSFLSAVGKNPVARLYHRFDPLRLLGPHHPQAFGLPLFIIVVAYSFPVFKIVADAIITLVVSAAGYGYYSYLKNSSEKDKDARES